MDLRDIYSQGDTVEVIENFYGHKFKVGQHLLVRGVTSIDLDCVHTDVETQESEHWFLVAEEVKLVSKRK